MDAGLDPPTLLEALLAGDPPPEPRDPPDLRGYVGLALRGGFPLPALQLSGTPRELWLESYVEDLITRDVGRLEGQRRGPKRDRAGLRSYFEAYALNSAGVIDDRSIFDAASLHHQTGRAYQDLFSRLFAIESVPAWSSNRLKRLTRQRKRYVIDPALMAAAAGVDEQGILADGDLIDRLLDTFVAAQIRPELTRLAGRARLHHLRTGGGRQEIDLLIELGGGRLIGIEIKATASPNRRQARHLAWLRDELGERFIAGIVFHTGPRGYALGERLHALPIATLWG